MKKNHNSCRGVKRTSTILVSICDLHSVLMAPPESDMGLAKSAQIVVIKCENIFISNLIFFRVILETQSMCINYTILTSRNKNQHVT